MIRNVFRFTMNQNKKSLRRICSSSLAIITSLSVLCVSGCSHGIQRYTPTAQSAITSYECENAPLKTINAGDYWYSIIGEYGKDGYAFSASRSPEEINIIYEAEDSRNWYFEATENYAVWSEDYENYISYKLYTRADNSVTEVFRADETPGFQISNVAIYEDGIYFSYIDYEKETADIVCYDISEETAESVFAADFAKEYSIMNFEIVENYLTATVCINDEIKVVVFELDNQKAPLITDLPEYVFYVYDVSYDYVKSTYALYYRDSDGKEHIGVLNTEENEIKNILTFNENYYAYEDNITCLDGHIYWISQANTSGYIAEHYKLVDYDYIEDVPEEYKHTFYFRLSEEGFYYLSFNNGRDYEKILLSKK